MKTFAQFTEAYTDAEAAKIAPNISPEKRRAALERNARNQARMKQPDTAAQRARTAPKALPAGKTGGQVVKAKSNALTTKPKAGALSVKPTGGALAKTQKAGALVKPGKKIPFKTWKRGIESSLYDEPRDTGEEGDNGGDNGGDNKGGNKGGKKKRKKLPRRAKGTPVQTATASDTQDGPSRGHYTGG